MKTCMECQKQKDLGQFYKWRNVCKGCLSITRKAKYLSDPQVKLNRQRVYTEQRRYKKLLLWEYLKTHPCIDCGERDPMILEFDHRERTEKTFELSEISRGRGLKTMWAEVEKCDVRCANCHRKKTWTDLKWKIPFIDYDWSDINVQRIKGLHGNRKGEENIYVSDGANVGPDR